jgi:hypothetical protein
MLFLVLITAVLSACAPAKQIAPTSIETSTPTATITSTPNPTETATEAPTATPEIQISPDDASYKNYEIPEQAFLDGNLVKKAHDEVKWGPPSPNPKYPNMEWDSDSNGLVFDYKTAPNFTDPNTRILEDHVMGVHTDGDTVTVAVAVRCQLQGVAQQDWPIFVGTIQSSKNQLDWVMDLFLHDMNFPVINVHYGDAPPSDLIAGKFFQENPDKIKVVQDALIRLNDVKKLNNIYSDGKSDYSAFLDFNNLILPLKVEDGKYLSGVPVYK